MMVPNVFQILHEAISIALDDFSKNSKNSKEILISKRKS